jgi:hypothetical protein
VVAYAIAVAFVGAAVIEVAGDVDEVPHMGSWGDPPTPQSERY